METVDPISLMQSDLQFRFTEINKNEAQRARMYLLTGRNGGTIDIDPSLPTDPLSRCWENQIISLVVAGAPKQLSMTEGEYRASLPKLQETPREKRERFPIPLLVDPRLSYDLQLRGFDDDVKEKGLSVNNITNRPQIITPSTPYQTWAREGSEYAGLNIDQFQQRLSNSPEIQERGLTFSELLALYRAKVEIFFEKRPTYNNFGFSFCSAASWIQSRPDGIPTIYHNYFDLKNFGEFQVDLFYNDVKPAGWPVCILPPT